MNKSNGTSVIVCRARPTRDHSLDSIIVNETFITNPNPFQSFSFSNLWDHLSLVEELLEEKL